MIRKFALAFTALAALGTVSLSAVTAASAHHFGGGGGFHHGGHFRGIGFYPSYDSCLRTRWVVNRFGNLVPRTVNVCY